MEAATQATSSRRRLTLASLGVHVVLASRDRAPGEQVVADIRAKTEQDRSAITTVDTAGQRSIRASAEHYGDTDGSTTFW